MNWRDGLTVECIEATLNKLPEVTWDRWTGDLRAETRFYGWIPRDDGRSDFVVLSFNGAELYSFLTSSHRHSMEFAMRLGFEVTDHKRCQRVEDFSRKVKAVRL